MTVEMKMECLRLAIQMQPHGMREVSADELVKYAQALEQYVQGSGPRPVKEAA